MAFSRFFTFAARCRRASGSIWSADSLNRAVAWLNRIDPGTHRRIKGLRLVTAYGIAALLGALPDITQGLRDGAALSALAGGFALWASVF